MLGFGQGPILKLVEHIIDVFRHIYVDIAFPIVPLDRNTAIQFPLVVDGDLLIFSGS